MALAFKCDQGHSYVAPDLLPVDWIEDMPLCPECRQEWLVQHQIKDLERVRLEPGDTLVVRLHSRQPPGEIGRLGDRLHMAFPDNKVLVLYGDMDLFVVEGSG